MEIIYELCIYSLIEIQYILILPGCFCKRTVLTIRLALKIIQFTLAKAAGIPGMLKGKINEFLKPF